MASLLYLYTARQWYGPSARCVNGRFSAGSAVEVWSRFLDLYEDRSRLTKGVKAAESKKEIKANLERLKAEEPLLWSFYAWLHDEKTRKGVSNNTLIAVNELELKLNGRDDYGLMYYTLTGTPRNTGYPAFLIIMERRKSGTHVHFHRVHPCRSKDGKPTPACRLVEECYRYMAGNVRAEEIYAQQGDIIFLKTEQTVQIPDDAKAVKEFESHAFKPLEDKPILLIPNETKSIKNRLGFIYSEGVFMVDHPEHEPIKGIPAGMYEVRRCKSWEANPKAVWVLTID
jgi:hypothetical protein